MPPRRARPSKVERDDRGRVISWNGKPVAFAPHVGPQTRFLSLSCFEALYGGAAGGGKSAAGVVRALRHVGKGYGPNYKALILRREFTEIELSILPECEKFYPALGGRYNKQKKYWRFPGGERVFLGHAQHLEDIKRYLGAEVQYIYFDEVTTFEQSQYLYAISRLRSAHGIPVVIRSGTNPGSRGHEWVFKRYAPWLDPESKLKAGPGEVLYFIRDEDGTEHCVPKGTIDYQGVPAIGRTFVPALSTDNPSLTASYRRQLDELDAVSRAQLKKGDWLIKPAKGLYYKRTWFRFVDAAPTRATRVRNWDLAGTEPVPGKDPDWTVGVLLVKPHEQEFRGQWFIEHVERMRGSPAEVESTILATAELDGPEVQISLAQDPGQAGKFQADYLVKMLGAKGFTARARPETGDKIHRQNPVSAQVERGNFCMVRGRWNNTFVQELEAFPEGTHDDDVDALSGAFAALTRDIQDYAPPTPQPAATIADNMGGF